MSDNSRDLRYEPVPAFFVGSRFEVEIQHSHADYSNEGDHHHDFRKGHSSSVVSGQRACGANDLQNI